MTPVLLTDLSVAAAAGPIVLTARREARLRPEHAPLYPCLRAGQWEPAAFLADRVLAGCLLRGRDALTLRRRPLNDEHFEFRGGGARVSDAASGRPRREDR